MWSSYSDEKLIATGWDPTSLKNNDFDSTTHKWNELDERCSDQEIELVGDVVNDGSFTSFIQFILPDIENGETIDVDRPKPYAEQNGFDGLKYQLAHKDSVGYIGYFYFFEHQDLFWGAPIQGPDGSFVYPSDTTIKDRSYPFVRPIFMVVNNDEESIRDAHHVIEFGLNNPDLMLSTGFVPIGDARKDEMISRLRNGPYLGGESTYFDGGFARQMNAVVVAWVCIILGVVMTTIT
jgi:phosphate transport system substrate-binding protein